MSMVLTSKAAPTQRRKPRAVPIFLGAVAAIEESAALPCPRFGLPPMSTGDPAATFDEIRALLRQLPGPDLEAGTVAAAREAQLTKPAGALGRPEALRAWLAPWRAKPPPTLRHPRTAVFAANHGVAKRGVSAYPAEVTAQMVANFVAGGAAVNQLCQSIDGD